MSAGYLCQSAKKSVLICGRMIGITFGDPAGIGPEILLKSLTKISSPLSKVRVIGSLQILEDIRKKLNLKLDIESLVYDVIPGFRYQFGKVQKSCGVAALTALELAIDLLKTGQINGIVTAPICKEAIRLAGFKFPGHTEFLANAFGIKEYAMLAYSPNLKIIFVTTHKPLHEVAKNIATKAVLAKILLLNDFLFLAQDSKIRCQPRPSSFIPRIGVLALNPHSFEFSAGEEEKIAKAIKKAQKLGIKVSGPFPSDTINELLNKYDGIVAMYHDQGMIPVKLLARDKGVNLTLGLPYPRTSPLHGCAFDIAGKGIANPSSMQAAIKLCLKLAKTKY
jgi:4-hydroxythreonine-4-phosphate dehydrogenase